MQHQVKGSVTATNNHDYLSHKFEVPEGATRLDIDFQYSPKRTGNYGNLLTLSLFDPSIERGTGHRGQPTQHITISASEATPGYTPGALQPGTWDVMVNCNLVNPGAVVEYQFEIVIGFEAQPAPVPAPARGSTKPRGAGWYRGDLHGHTIHSDGHWDCDGLLGFAQQHQLDFISLTDHNTMSALAQMDSLSSDDLLTMGGFELTTFYGHALALGIRTPIDWRVRPGRTMTDIRAEIEAAGGLFIIAHPACPGDPICTGCHWDYFDLMPGNAALVEVCNEQWGSGSNNPGAVELWYEWLNTGHHLYATVGTDIHGPNEQEFAFNVVYAQGLAEKAILDALRLGHSYLSSGPQLEFTGRSPSGATAMVGDSLSGDTCELSIRWSDLRDGDCIRVMVDGQPKQEWTPNGDGQHIWSLSGSHWCVIEVRDGLGNMRALTNPIFVGAG